MSFQYRDVCYETGERVLAAIQAQFPIYTYVGYPNTFVSATLSDQTVTLAYKTSPTNTASVAVYLPDCVQNAVLGISGPETMTLILIALNLIVFSLGVIAGQQR